MKYLLQFCRILVICFLSEVLHAVIPLPVPAGIYGIAILFLLLETGLLKLEKVREAGKFMVEIMPVLFIPGAVGLLESWGLVADSLVAYLALIIVSTMAVMAVSGLVTQAVIRLSRKKGGTARE